MLRIDRKKKMQLSSNPSQFREKLHLGYISNIQLAKTRMNKGYFLIIQILSQFQNNASKNFRNLYLCDLHTSNSSKTFKNLHSKATFWVHKKKRAGKLIPALFLISI